MVLPKALGKNLPCLSQLPVVVSSPWHSLACGHIAPVSASVFTWPSPLCVYVSSHSLLIRTSVTGCRVYLYTTYYVCKDSLSKQSHVLKFWMNSDFMGAQWTPQQTLPKEHLLTRPRPTSFQFKVSFPKNMIWVRISPLQFAVLNGYRMGTLGDDAAATGSENLTIHQLFSPQALDSNPLHTPTPAVE